MQMKSSFLALLSISYAKVHIKFEKKKNILTFVSDLKKMKRYYLLGFFSVLAAICSAFPPKYEVRAVWLTTIGGIDWPHSYARSSVTVEQQKKELTDILDRLKKANINTVLLQTRIRATTIYPSAYEPWDGCLSGVPGRSPGYDALGFAVEECHRRGMEIHAWVVCMPVGQWTAEGCKRLRKRYPQLLRKIGAEGYMNPEHVQTASYLADVCEEITRNYDVDGIHLDYIRYPEAWPIKVSRDQGRQYITNIVRQVSRRVKTLKPWVKMSCAPIGKHDDLARYSSRGWNAYTRTCQDAQGWLRDGIMDMLFPMLYFRDDQFFPFAIDWSEQCSGRVVAAGLGAYMLSAKEGNWPLSDIERQMYISRSYGLGQAFFRSKFFTDNTKGIYGFSLRFYDSPALVPPMTWQSRDIPAAPAGMQIRETADGCVLLSWDASSRDGRRSAALPEPAILYNVYSSPEYPVDVSDARNLMVSRLSASSVAIPEGRGRYYAVTAVSRYGLESRSLQQPEPESQSVLSAPALPVCRADVFELPDAYPSFDSRYYLVETLQGRIVLTVPFQGRSVPLHGVPNGVYVLRSLNDRGVSHRLGFFMVKR